MSHFLLTDAQSAHDLVRHLSLALQAAGISDFREAPPEPTGCCGRGCSGCVWEGYFAAVGWWREDALLLLGRQE